VFCQKNTSDVLVVSGRNTEQSEGYATLEKHLTEFEKIGHLPPNLRNLAATLQQHVAKWHKDCRTKLRSRELNRKRNHDFTDTLVDEHGLAKCTRSSSSTSKSAEKFPSVCLFCDENGDSLSQAMTMDIDTKVRSAAYELSKEKLIRKLTDGDMVARECKYHKTCLVKLYNEQRAVCRQLSPKDAGRTMAESIVFAQLVTYVEECCEDILTAPAFQLSKLKKLYDELVKGHGYDSDCHSTRLKEKLMVNS